MWTILEFCLFAMIVLVSITEFFYPLLMGKPLFGSFRKTTATEDQGNDESIKDEPSLKEKVSKAKEKIKEVKDIQDEVNDNFKSAEQLKAEADDLLKNTNQ
jgi:hypothetical protein